jgi:hypothetical protein
MAFDSKAFKRAAFEPRTQIVKVPELADFFKEGEAPELTARGLTGIEVSATTDAYNKHGLLVTALEQGKITKDQIKQIFGDEEKASAESMRSYKVLQIVYGFDLDLAKKLNRDFVAVFNRLVTAVWALTEMGSVKKKPTSCSETDESKTV